MYIFMYIYAYIKICICMYTHACTVYMWNDNNLNYLLVK